MREIKFRGKRLDNGEWVKGNLVRCDNGRCLIVGEMIEANEEYCNIEYWYPVDPATVGQYTGRKTDNCKIYEGDMCIVTRFNHNGRDYQYKFIVEWLDGGFYFICEEKEMYIPVSEVEDTASDVEVIGNIHDNSELLEGGER